MTLLPGTRLGPYDVGAQIGVGGMGEVYRATDTNLGRQVAIKVLPEAFARSADRLARFGREAKVLASLNHPNIAQVYGLEKGSGISALVMELVEGPTLHDRVARKPMPLAEALPIATQIALALEAAHEQGIIHRDLKPANIKVRPDGTVKVLDFGLAKLVGPPEGGPHIQDDAVTSPAMMTGPGVVLGTAAYMSPEQARGQAVDTRTDIWAFGCVLYEMLTGQAAFAGETASDTIARILEREPDWQALPAATSPAVRRLLARCLDRNVKRRLRDIGEARVVLEDPAAEIAAGATGTGVPAVTTPRLWQRAAPMAITVIVTGSLAGAAWYIAAGRATPPMVTRLEITLPDGQGFTGNNRHVVALSRDGTQLVYVANSQLHLRLLSEGSGQPIAGTDGFRGVSQPAFSPDGRSIVFYAFDGTLRRIAVTGGAAVTLTKLPDAPYGLHWGDDGIVFGLGGLGIMRVSPDGGTPDVIVRVKDGEQAHGPQLLSSDRVLFTLATGTATDRWDKASVVVQSIASGERSMVIDGGSDARYIPTGHLVYAVSGSVFAVPFDVGRRYTTGSQVPVVQGVKRAAGNGTGAAQFSVSDTGSFVYVPGPSSASLTRMDIAIADRQGKVEPLRLPPGPYNVPRVSPDGARIAFETDDGEQANVHVYDLSGRTVMRQLTNEGNNRFPVWSPNGARITFQSDRDGDLALFWQRADGTGVAERLTTPGTAQSHAPESWSRDGNTLLFSVTTGSEVTLWILSLPDRKTTRFGAVRSTIPIGAVFSRDGRWVAYASAAANRTTIYVEPFPQTGAKYQVPTKGSDTPKQPRWSWDGKELFYNPNSNTFEAMSVSTTPTFALGNAVTLTRRLLLGPPTSRTNYDPMPDGRFVGVVTAGEAEYVRGSTNQIQVILNWFEELKRLAPIP